MKKIPLLKVNQWLDSWNAAHWTERLPEPSKCFYLASMNIKELRRLAGVSRRDIEARKRNSINAGYQRALEQSRTKKISRYLQVGYPLSSSNLDVEQHRELIHPGWLPTAILVNILKENDIRFCLGRECKVDRQELLEISATDEGLFLHIPDDLVNEPQNKSQTLRPIEVIDGQHRLFSIDEDLLAGSEYQNYEVPVVIFEGLSLAWQAYLFWVINVEPRRVNTSLAFDLYPELRSQSWLENGESIKIYQEHRSQELTEILWRHSESVWKDRIELLGKRVPGHVSNAAFIRSLSASFIRSWGKNDKIGGLFGSIDVEGKERILPWKRTQQASFLLLCWSILSKTVMKSTAEWVESLRKQQEDVSTKSLDVAFAGKYSLMATDQGVRALHYVFNAMSKFAYKELSLAEWDFSYPTEFSTDEEISLSLKELEKKEKIVEFLEEICSVLVNEIDWRLSGTPGLSIELKTAQAAYRGSSGYSLLRDLCLTELGNSRNALVSHCAQKICVITRK